MMWCGFFMLTFFLQIRNMLVAVIADEVYFIHAEPGGSLEELKRMVVCWGKEVVL